jgi:hypothetical protein
MSERTKLPPLADPDTITSAMSARESWRIFGIMAEFVEATERLSAIRPAVSIFGSARIKPESPYYQLTEEIARKLDLAESTVKIHVQNIFKKLNMSSRVQVALYAVENGYGR